MKYTKSYRHYFLYFRSDYPFNQDPQLLAFHTYCAKSYDSKHYCVEQSDGEMILLPKEYEDDLYVVINHLKGK